MPVLLRPTHNTTTTAVSKLSFFIIIPSPSPNTLFQLEASLSKVCFDQSFIPPNTIDPRITLIRAHSNTLFRFRHGCIERRSSPPFGCNITFFFPSARPIDTVLTVQYYSTVILTRHHAQQHSTTVTEGNAEEPSSGLSKGRPHDKNAEDRPSTDYFFLRLFG